MLQPLCEDKFIKIKLFINNLFLNHYGILDMMVFHKWLILCNLSNVKIQEKI